MSDKLQQNPTKNTALTTHERRQTLIDLLRKQPGLRVPEIAEQLGISEGTVRNDLNALESGGQLTRVHGGAVLNDGIPPFFNIRQEFNSREKNSIGRQAAGMIADGDAIYLDSSSTAYYLALNLKSKHRLRVVTNGIDVARLLAQNPDNVVILIGGVLSQDGSSLTGLVSEQVISELHVQKAFVSCSGFSLGRGLTEVFLEEAQLKRKILASAGKLFALVDSTKIGKDDLTAFARPDQITHLYTDYLLPSGWAERLAQAQIQFTVCTPDDQP